MTKYALSIISTFVALLPIFFGAIKIKKADTKYRLLVLLLIYGFLTDLLVGFFFNNGYEKLAQMIFNIYSPIEVVLFSFIFYKMDTDDFIKKISFVVLIISPIVWMFLNFNFSPFFWKDSIYNPIYVSLYEIIIACIAASVLLGFTRKKEILNKTSQFWLVLGIFIYCFCTFLVNGLVQTKIINEIWYLHNVINIITYLIFTKAFLTIKNKSLS